MFSHQSLEQFSIHSIYCQHTVMKMLSVLKDSSPWSFLLQIRVQISNSFLIHGNVFVNDITLWLLCLLFPHTHFTCHGTAACHMSWGIYSMNKDWFNGVHCDCFPLFTIILSTLCAKFIYILWLNCLYEYSCHAVGPFII